MSKTKKRNSSRKGDYGYLASEKKRRILITAVSTCLARKIMIRLTRDLQAGRQPTTAITVQIVSLV